MLQAVRLDGPRRMIAEDLSDPSLLGTGEHGGRYRSRTAPRGPVRVSSPRRAHKEPEWATARGLVPPTRAKAGLLGSYPAICLTYTVHSAPVVAVPVMMPTTVDRHRHKDASLSYEGNCQEQQRDPQIAHSRTSLDR